MELAVARKLVNAHANSRNAVSVHQQLAGDPRYNAAENRYARLLVQAEAGPRPWPRHVQHRLNNANKRRLEVYSNSGRKMMLARERLNKAKAEALVVFGPEWVNMRHLNVRPFVRLLEAANSRARTIVRKYMSSTMAAKANARRRQRNMISHELSFYTMGKNNNNNTTIKPSIIKRRRLSNN